MDVLQDIWEADEDSPRGHLICIECGKRVGPDDTLARTFTVHDNETDSTGAQDGQRSPSTVRSTHMVEVPWLNKYIYLHNRHLACLQENVAYVCVSHVWHQGVAALQFEHSQHHPADPETAQHVAEAIRDIPVRIYLGIQRSSGIEPGTLEVWHDYLSVPQWHQSHKHRIIQSIPTLYSHAAFVVAYFHDVHPHALAWMRHGTTAEERIRGMNAICNAQWFRRMWTAMECVQASQLRAMLSDFSIVAPLPERASPAQQRLDVPLLSEVEAAWIRERQQHEGPPPHGWGSSTQAEQEMTRLAQSDKNLLHHRLGPLQQVRQEVVVRMQGRAAAPCFAQAFGLISRRLVTVPSDFVYALLGLLGRPLGPVREKSNIQKPSDTASSPRDYQQQQQQEEEELLKELPLENLARAGAMIARACIQAGDASPLFLLPWRRDAAAMLTQGFDEFGMYGLGPQTQGLAYPEVRITATGNPILHLETVGEVYYAKRMPRFYVADTWHDFARRVVEITGPRPEVFIHTVCRRFFGEFEETARRHVGDEAVRERVGQILDQLYDMFPAVRNEELTEELATLLWLNTAHQGAGIGGLGKLWAPMDFMNVHGRVMHGNDDCTMVGVKCPVCHESFLLQVALIPRNNGVPAAVLGAVAYRVPGLQYALTHKGGAGWLIKNGHIMARFVWCQSTCECHPVDEVEVPFPDGWVPEPVPNTYDYGNM